VSTKTNEKSVEETLTESISNLFESDTVSCYKFAHIWSTVVSRTVREQMVYNYRTDRPLGMSRISRAVMSLHDQALRTVIRMEGHADTYSFPEMWLLGADESIFKNADGTQKAVWQVMLGRIKAIPDDEEAASPRADVKQFSASSPQPHIDQLKQQAQLFSGETSIPLTSPSTAAPEDTAAPEETTAPEA